MIEDVHYFGSEHLFWLRRCENELKINWDMRYRLFLSLSAHFLCHKWLLTVSPSRLGAISLLYSVRGYWMGVSDGERRRVGTYDRHGWAVSVVMATRKCIYHSVDQYEVNTDHSPSFFTAYHPLCTRILLCVVYCLTFSTVSLSSSVIFSLILFFPILCFLSCLVAKTGFRFWKVNFFKGYSKEYCSHGSSSPVLFKKNESHLQFSNIFVKPETCRGFFRGR